MRCPICNDTILHHHDSGKYRIHYWDNSFRNQLQPLNQSYYSLSYHVIVDLIGGKWDVLRLKGWVYLDEERIDKLLALK
jgi:hypothetical protein